jgi:hypothetical protein
VESSLDNVKVLLDIMKNQHFVFQHWEQSDAGQKEMGALGQAAVEIEEWRRKAEEAVAKV